MARQRPSSHGRSQFRPTGLVPYFNNVGISSACDTSVGRFNVWHNSLPAETLPPGGPITVHGIPFEFPKSGVGAPDNIRCAGQYISLLPGSHDWIYLLVAGERRVEDEVALHFEAGEVDFEALRVSDFWAAPAAFGESPAFRSSAMHYPHHVQPGLAATIWLQRVPVIRRIGVLVGLRLPRNVAIHVFALTLCASGEGMEDE